MEKEGSKYLATQNLQTTNGIGKDFFGSKLKNQNEKKIVLDVDGWKIIGILNIPESQEKLPLVILGHTLWGGEKSEYKDFVKVLSKNNIASLRIDLRGHGESINKGTINRLDTDPAYLFDAWPDIVAAHKYVENLSSIHPNKIGVLASSYSGELAAQAGKNYKYANAYVILSSALFSQESTLRIQYSNADWWHIVAKDDITFAKEVVSFVKKRSPSKVTFFESGGHGPELLESHKDLSQQIANWFNQKLHE